VPSAIWRWFDALTITKPSHSVLFTLFARSLLMRAGPVIGRT